MRAKTKPYGEIEVDERQLIEFSVGIFGFDDLKRYAILDAARPPFYWLQSLDRPGVAFVLVDPRAIVADYRLDVSEEDLGAAGIEDPRDILDFVIVTIPADPREMTANLQGPIVINRKTRAARQCISRNPEHGVRHRILGAGAPGSGSSC